MEYGSALNKGKEIAICKKMDVFGRLHSVNFRERMINDAQMWNLRNKTN